MKTRDYPFDNQNSIYMYNSSDDINNSYFASITGSNYSTSFMVVSQSSVAVTGPSTRFNANLARGGSIDEGIQALRKGLACFEEIGNIKGKCYIYNSMAIAQRMAGQIDSALYFNEEALAVFQSQNMKYETAGVLLNIGNIYRQTGRSIDAIPKYEESLSIFQSLGVKHGVFLCYTNMAEAYSAIGNTAKTQEFAEKGLALEEQLNSMSSKLQLLDML